MTPVLQRMTDLVQTSTRSFYLTNAAGDYLAHPDPEKEFGFDLGRNHRLQDDFKALAPIMADKARKTATEIIGINGDQTIVSMDRLYMSPNKPSQYLVALGMSPMANLLVNNVQQRNQVILLTIVLAVIGGLAGLILARLIVRPLRQLTIAAGELALGADFDKVAIPVHRSDEVGVLARAFRNMAQTIKARQEALEDERARSTAVLETALSPIITINDRGIIQDANPATTRLFGYKRGELIGQNVKMLMTSKDRDNHDNYLETYHKTRIPKIMGNGREVTAQRKDGTTVPVHLAVSELHLKDRVMFTGIITDMTEHKKVDKLKNEFVSTVSHELRTPLTSIKGSLGLLQSAVLGELPPQMKSMIGIAYSNSDRLVRLINDILDIEKIEAGKLTFDFQRTDLKPLLERIIDANRGYGQGKRVSIELLPMTARPFVEADPDRLTQVITNFLSNAIKFSPEGGTVQVSAAVAGGTVRVSVTDHGPGISEEFQGKIFGKFAQEDSSSTKAQGGTGLGLAISKAIVEAHGGTIDFSSEIDKGTTFFFEIAELSTARTATVDTSPEDREKILICEDDADMATLLRLIVSDMGYEGVICSDARTAKDALSGNRFVAMTVDLALPGQDGISLIRDLRDDPETESLPVIVVSARAQDGRVEADTAAYRVIDWLEKPIDVNRLRAGLTNAVKDFASERPRILYVDDDTDHLFVVSSLVGANTVIDTATTCVQARDLLNRHDYDLVLLDLILPDGDGESLLHLIDANGDRAPQVIVFSVKDLPESFAGKVDRRLIKSRTSNSALKDQIEKLLARRKHREQEFRLAKSEPKRTEVMEESGVD